MIIQAIRNLGFTGPISEKEGVIDWRGATPLPQADIDAEVQRLQAEYDSLEYARLRKAEYDKLNQFEMQFDDQVNGTTTWVDAINEIKARYPK